MPEEGETLIDFMTEDESRTCHACPEIGPKDVPGVACAFEFEPSSDDPKIGCHESKKSSYKMPKIDSKNAI